MSTTSILRKVSLMVSTAMRDYGRCTMYLNERSSQKKHEVVKLSSPKFYLRLAERENV